MKSLNHLINSSILMAYLICLGWSIAYVCGWLEHIIIWLFLGVGAGRHFKYCSKFGGYVVFFQLSSLFSTLVQAACFAFS